MPRPEKPLKIRPRAYGVMVRTLDRRGTWMWLKPDGHPTGLPVEAAHWSGPDGERSAMEAAKSLSRQLPGFVFRVTRKPNA